MWRGKEDGIVRWQGSPKPGCWQDGRGSNASRVAAGKEAVLPPAGPKARGPPVLGETSPVEARGWPCESLRTPGSSPMTAVLRSLWEGVEGAPGRPAPEVLSAAPGVAGRRSRRRRLPEASGGALALSGGAPAELGAAVGGGLARGDGGRGRAAAPRGGRAQGGGAAGRRLPEASARAGGSGPQGERQRHAG